MRCHFWQAEVCVGALGLLDHHLFEVQDDPHGCGRRVGQHLAHPIEVEQQVLERRVHLVRGERHVHHRLQHRARHAHCAPRPRIDLVQPPLGGVGEGQQLQGLAGRGAVDDQDVVLPPLRVVLDPHQRRDLVHPWRIRDFIGQHLIEALSGEDLDRVLVELCPVPLHLVQRRDLMRPEVVSDPGRLGAQLDVKRVAKRMGGVGAHDDGAVPGGRAPNGGGGGDRRLAHTALPGEKNDSHAESLRSGRLPPSGGRLYLTSSGMITEPTPSRTIMAAPTTRSRTRSLVKYGTRSSGIDGSLD